MSIEFTEETKQAAIEAIKQYFEKERDESIGDLAADMLLDFFTAKLAPLIYNQALIDARTWFRNQMEYLESDFAMLEKDFD